MPTQTAALLLILAAATGAESARAELSAAHPSINGTGETLPDGESELGIGSAAYGVTSDWMVRIPTLSLLVGYGRAEARYRQTFDAFRVSPYLFAETPEHGGAGADLGTNLGVADAHSITAGGRARYGRSRGKVRTVFRPNAEYDFYHDGNVAFVGMSDWLLYGGYTWGWSSFHLGLIMSPAGGLLPYPYVYWRF